jgi:predicted nucleic acid-binding protein
LAKATSLTIDLRKIIRSRKPEKRQTRLAVRPDIDLISASDIAGRGRQVFVPDTNIYIMDAAGILQQAAETLVDQGLMFHCSICLAEISVGVGKYAPKASGWQRVADHYAELFASIPANRLLIPDAETWADAGMVAGILARTQGLQRQRSKELLNDAVIYLCAAKNGLPVLTDNKADFDLLQQLAPGGRFIFV